MKFLDSRENQPINEAVTSTCDFPEISQQEIGGLDERQYPYQSLVRVFHKDSAPVFQPLEPASRPEVGLRDYRSLEVERILGLLENNQVVSLVAPSRAAKTEAVLLGDYNAFSNEDTLYGRTNGYFFDISGNFSDSLTDEQLQDSLDYRIESNEEDRDQEPRKIAICDEFAPDSSLHQKILQALLQRGFKCVITQGGFLSNVTKRASVDNLASQIGLAIPTVEMGIKPFNARQLQEMAERNNVEDSPRLKQLVDLSYKIPLPYHIAVDAVNSTRHDPVTEESLWKKLHDPHSGIYSIGELMQAIK